MSGSLSSCAVLLIAAACFAGCSGKKKATQPNVAAPAKNVPAAAQEPARPRVPVGVIVGRVVLAAGEDLPLYRPPTQILDPLPGCPRYVAAEDTPFTTNEQRGLEGVGLLVIGFDQSPPHQPQTHRVAIRNCMLFPRTIIATDGDTLLLKNESQNAFFPSLGNTPGISEALLSGGERSIPLKHLAETGGITRLECRVISGCGKTEVVTLRHPVHGTSDIRGEFRITNVPVGKPIEVGVWHPLLQFARVTVTPVEGQEVRIPDITVHVSPHTREPATPPLPPATSGHPEHQPGLF